MREIKFRVWDGVLMHNVSELHFCMGPKLDGKGLKFYGPGVGQGWIDGEQTHLMQYTGLKDKNGVEIYEGDIVRTWEEDEHVPNRDSGGGIIDFNRIDGFSQLGVVSFKGAWFTYETKKYLSGRKEDIYAPLDFTNDLIVVGNIYENPELLES